MTLLLITSTNFQVALVCPDRRAKTASNMNMMFATVWFFNFVIMPPIQVCHIINWFTFLSKETLYVILTHQESIQPRVQKIRSKISQYILFRSYWIYYLHRLEIKLEYCCNFLLKTWTPTICELVFCKIFQFKLLYFI